MGRQLQKEVGRPQQEEVGSQGCKQAGRQSDKPALCLPMQRRKKARPTREGATQGRQQSACTGIGYSCLTPVHTWKPPGTGMLGPSSVSNSQGKDALTSSVEKKPSKLHCCFSRNIQLSENTASSSGVKRFEATICAGRRRVGTCRVGALGK